MRTISTPIYNFEDVIADKNLLAKVLEKNRYYNVANENNFLIQDFEERTKMFGLNVSKTYYSGFWSQGDGACFVGTYQAKSCSKEIENEYPNYTILIDCVERLEELRLLCGGFLRIEITHSGRYVHENSMDFDIIVDEDFEEHIDFIEHEAKEIFKIIAKDLYKSLEKDYFYRISNEGLTEYFENSDLEFLEDGSIFSE